MIPEEKSKIEELKKSLYSRNAPLIRPKKRFHLGNSDDNVNVSTDWVHPEEKTDEVELNKRYENRSMSFFKKLLIGSMVFFLLAVGMGIFLMLNGSNIISANNIDIVVNGPVTISGGDKATFNIQVNNKNNIKLQSVDLVVDFPVGTVEASDESKELKEYREFMDDIVPGGMGQKTVDAVIYGEENTKKEIIIEVSYKVAGSNAVFKKRKTYDVLISSSPLSLSVSSFKEITAGQEFDMTVTLASNSEEIIRNLLLKVTYPFGYSFISSDLKPESTSGIWRIGDIPSKGKKSITIKGKLEAQDEEMRAFNFTVGRESASKKNVIGTEYVATRQEIAIQKPFISTAISFEGDDPNGKFIGAFNSPIKVSVAYFNNLPVSIIDGEIKVKLSGNAFDKLSVAPENGYYRSLENEIVWNKQTTSDLGDISPGEGGIVTFSITPRDFSTPAKAVSNPGISVDVSVEGKRLSESNVPENIISSAKRSLKISSNLSLSASVLRSTGPFQNTGPIPPRKEKQTTYTILLTVDNTANTITGAEVHALLPPYVKWMNKINPAGEDINYNTNTGEIVWRVGDVDAYTVYNSKRRQVAIQVYLEPSAAQVGQVLTLVEDITLTGQDDFTLELLSRSINSLTTRFSSDPSFRNGDDIVAP